MFYNSFEPLKIDIEMPFRVKPRVWWGNKLDNGYKNADANQR